MNRAVTLCALLLLAATTALAEWETIATGVDYQRFQAEKMDVHVARVDLSKPDVRLVATRESERGLRVSDFAKKSKALVAINADYFNEKLVPIGLAMSPCGIWENSKDTEREGVVALGEGRAAIYPQREVLAEPEPWMTSAVSGWPMLVKECKALTASELPGSDAFTRSPHPRTAVGVTSDGKTLYLVVADGRKEGVPGMTLARLAAFLRDELGVCAAMNLDGGGSSAMWVRDAIVNRPSDNGSERRVANHVAVVTASEIPPCELKETKATVDAAAIEDTKKREEAEQRGNAAATATAPPTPATPPKKKR